MAAWSPPRGRASRPAPPPSPRSSSPRRGSTATRPNSSTGGCAKPRAAPAWPAGAILQTWTDEAAPRFFAVYEAAFRERPGFPHHHAATWIGDLEEDDDFRPALSLLVEVPGLGDAGFVTAAAGWIDQVGVIPQARRLGLGAALTRESLTRMRADGATEAWLNVNVDNPAKNVYLRLGFIESGRRARFEA